MPLLNREPQGAVESLSDLLGLALALEREAVRRYRQLADLMERRGEVATAAVFRALMAEETAHTAGVENWIGELGLPAPDAPAFVWRLPPEIAASWEELTGRTSLSPYQALSLAVLNEQRAFAFYSYIGAATGSEQVRIQAESLAREELGHAALLRRERRKAYRLDRAAAGTRPAHAATPGDLDRLAGRLLAEAAATHAALATRLEQLGEHSEAALLRRIAEEERAVFDGIPTPETPAPAVTAQAALHSALRLSEKLAETFADVATTATDEAVLNRALQLQEMAVRHLSLSGDRTD